MAEYTFQHYVPRTYLEAWENKKEQLTVYVKGEDRKFLKNTNKVLGENDYYTLTADNLLVLKEDDRRRIFGFLNEYTIYFNNKRLLKLDDYVYNLNKIDEWIIRNNEGFLLDSGEIKNRIFKERMLPVPGTLKLLT